MVSNIDETRPITGIDQPVQVIRDNFAIAKIEIGELQARKFNIDGTSTLTGPLGLASFTLAGLPPAVDNEGNLVFVTDASPNPSPFFSDGITWSALTGGISGLFNVVEDLNPQLGGALDAQNNKIVNLGAPTANADAATKNYVDTTTATSAQGALADSALQNVVEDLSPQLGAQLDVNTFGLGDGTNLLLDFVEDASAVNHIEIENEATGSGPIIRSAGADTNIDLLLKPKGIGEVQVGIDTANAVITSADAPVSSGNSGRSLTLSSGSGDGVGDGGDILITPGTAPGAGTDGSLILVGLVWPIVDGTSGQALTTDGTGNLSFTTIPGTGLFNVVEDLSPQLGGQLDVNGKGLGDGTNLLLDFVEDASAVNHIEIENEATGSGPIIRAAGADTNIDLNISAKGTGIVNLGSGGVKLNAPLDVNGNAITSAVTITLSTVSESGTIDVTSNKIVNLGEPTVNQDAATKNYVDTTTATSAQGTLADSALQNVVEDTNPQLGGDLDISIFAMTTGGEVVLDFASGGETAVNNIEIVNGITGFGPIIRSVGADTNVDLNLSSKGTGVVNITGAVTVSSTVDGRDLSIDGAKLDLIEALADVTDATNVNAAGAVMETDYNAQTVLIAVADDTPLPVTVAASTFVGRKAAGDVGTMTVAEALTLLNVEAGAAADQTAADIRGLGFFDTTNDGPTSGLDADLLDGLHASSFATSAQGALADSALQNVVDDTAPQLGGQLDVNTFGLGDGTNLLLDFVEDASAVNHIQIENEGIFAGPIIRSVGADTNVDLVLDTKGTGAIVLDGLKWPITDGTLDQFLRTDGFGTLSFFSIQQATGNELENVVEDLTPQLGGDLDVGIFAMTIAGGIVLDFAAAGEFAVNNIQVLSNNTGFSPIIRSIGADTNIDLSITPKGTGNIVLDGLNWPISDGTNGQALTTDGGGNLSFTEMVPVTTFTTQTTTAAQTTIGSISVTSGTSLYFTIKGHGRENATGDTKGSKIEGVISNTSGTTVLVGSLHIIDIDTAGAATWDITAEANDGTDALDIKVTGEAAHTIDWKLRVETIEE